jgi:DNA-binding transcriptional LysR family regulator
MFNWDDLRVFLAAARRRSYHEAAAHAGLDATTIGRRIARLETALHSTLIVRGPGGLSLTGAGQRLFEAASAIEATTEAIGETVAGDGAWGVVRVSVSEGFGTTLIAPALPLLKERRQHLTVELVANPGFYSPVTREVDLAITLSPPQDVRLTVELLTEYHLGLYAARSYLDKAGTPRTPEELTQHDLIGYIDDLLYANELRYLDEIHPGLRPGVASSSIRAQLEIIAAGGGIGVLPRFLAVKSAPELVPVLPRKVRLSRTFWIAARRDVQQTTRVRAVQAWVRDIVARNKDAFLFDAK